MEKICKCCPLECRWTSLTRPMTAPKPHRDDPRYRHDEALLREDLKSWEKGYANWGKETCACGEGYFCQAHGEWVSGDGVRTNKFPNKNQQRPDTCHPCPRCKHGLDREHTCGRQFSTRKGTSSASSSRGHPRPSAASSSRTPEQKGKSARVQSRAPYDYKASEKYGQSQITPTGYDSSQTSQGGIPSLNPGSTNSRSLSESEYQYQSASQYHGKAPQQLSGYTKYNEVPSYADTTQADFHHSAKTGRDIPSFSQSSTLVTGDRSAPYDPYKGQDYNTFGSSQVQPPNTETGRSDYSTATADQSRRSEQYLKTIGPYGDKVTGGISNAKEPPAWQTISTMGQTSSGNTQTGDGITWDYSTPLYDQTRNQWYWEGRRNDTGQYSGSPRWTWNAHLQLHRQESPKIYVDKETEEWGPKLCLESTTSVYTYRHGHSLGGVFAVT